MFFKRFSNQDNRSSRPKKFEYEVASPHLIPTSSLAYSWVITGQLAIGPIPKTSTHWHQLESDGFKSRFSCCYPNEHIYEVIPSSWASDEISLPDHRSQEVLTIEKLILALERSIQMLEKSDGALYLHCFAGQERSALVAVGMISVLHEIDLFESLDFIRQCHKRARPLYSQLDLLDTALKKFVKS
jgi:hypothetical protein